MLKEGGPDDREELLVEIVRHILWIFVCVCVCLCVCVLHVSSLLM